MVCGGKRRGESEEEECAQEEGERRAGGIWEARMDGQARRAW